MQESQRESQINMDNYAYVLNLISSSLNIKLSHFYSFPIDFFIQKQYKMIWLVSVIFVKDGSKTKKL